MKIITSINLILILFLQCTVITLGVKLYKNFLMTTGKLQIESELQKYKLEISKLY
jgi:hypothetical protein